MQKALESAFNCKIISQVVRNAMQFLTQPLSDQREERTHLPRQHHCCSLNMVLEYLNIRIAWFQVVTLPQPDLAFAQRLPSSQRLRRICMQNGFSHA